MTKKKKGVCSLFSFPLLFWVLLSRQLSNVFCLKDLKIFVPEAVVMGNAATLTCQYDLEDASLYSVRWYFESEEFYRYVPKEAPPARTFPVSGITVDVSHSDATTVTLRSVTRDLTGLFQCEVSEDAPLFHTDIRASRMQVVELPNEEPKLNVEKKFLTSNDNLKASCQVGTSFPAANITWYINGKKLYKTPFQRITYRAFEGTPTFSSLELFPHSPVLMDIYSTSAPYSNSIIIACEVTIFHIYHKPMQQRVLLTDFYLTTMSPNILGWDGRKKSGDPDNSALTGAATASNKFSNTNVVVYLVILFSSYFYHYFSNDVSHW